MKLIITDDREVSTSAKRKSEQPEVKLTSMDALIPVQLPDAEMAEFVGAFHPKRQAKAPQAFMEQILFLTEVSGYINSIYTGLRYGLYKLSELGADLDSESVGRSISREIEVTYAATKEQERIAKAFMGAISTGAHHIIRDSVRYKGGKDIVYSGLRGPNVSPLLSSEHPTPHGLPLLKSSYTYQGMSPVFASVLGKALLDTGRMIQELLLGEGVDSVKSTYTRINLQHTIGLKWTLLQEITRLFVKGPLAKLGVPVILPEFKGVLTEHAVSRLSKYVSVLALREPAYTAALQRSKNKDVPEESLDICVENSILQPDIRFSLVINLPKNFCEYITQTKDAAIPLVQLNTWATVWSTAMLRPPRSRASEDGRQSGDGARLITPVRAPRYVLRPSASDELLARRKSLGLYSEPGRVNEDGMLVTYNGDLSFLPTAEETATENAKAYEQLLEDALETSYTAGTPLAAGQKGSTGIIFDLASPNYSAKIQSLKEKLVSYKGSALTLNWDLNTVLTVSLSDPDRLVSTKLTGGTKPDALNLATYLRLPLAKAMRDMFSRTRFKDPADRQSMMHEGVFESMDAGITGSTIFENFALLYNHLLKQELVPSLQELITKAAKALSISSLNDEAVAEYELNRLNPTKSIYGSLIPRDLVLTDVTLNAGSTIRTMFSIAAHQATAGSGTTLGWHCVKNNVIPDEHDRFFSGSRSTAGELSKLYQWFGGQVFLQAILAILALPKSTFINHVEVPIDATNPDDKYPNFLAISREVLPMCVVYGKYVMPEIRDKLYEEADEIVENRNKFSEQDLNLAGSRGKDVNGKGGMKLFPHQAVALAMLKAHPKIAVLDIAPGGGKTTIGLSDIACTVADGLIRRPFVFCPPRLVRNWIEDLHKSFKGWNAIPITTETYAEWGEERLTELIQNAPMNTVVVVGNSFISNTPKQQLVIGNTVDTLSNAVEFCKKFEPDYVMIDESHRIRNTKSAIHQGIKTVSQMSSVKYIRIATGTLIQNVLSDVVGQSAVFNGQIFRTIDDFESAHKGVVAIVNDRQVIDYYEDTPLKARRRLSEFATVISFKRKEWAFMLPMPIETFITVAMDEHGDQGHMLQQFYNAVLKATLEEAKNDPKLKKLKSGKGAEEDDDDSSEAVHGRTVQNASGTSVEVSDTDDDSDDEDNLEAALQPYLQRLERLLTDPFGDEDLLPVAKEIFGDAFAEDYVTPKVQKVIDRIRLHFTPNEWQKGKIYKAADIVDFNAKSYIFKSDLPAGHGEERSDMSPDSDTTNWKPQIRGKIFIACRYTRSVDAIYRALPKDLRDRAVRFHGEVDNKDESLNKFQNDPKTEIFIANEMGVSEGHNFQMATRFIRVEAPWAPGELDQTASRIFRPDVGGEYTRQTIFLDWILCDNTLEVAKMGRLISKMLKRAQFDELDNPKYYKGLNPANLPIIKMSLDNIRSLYRVDDLCSFAGEGSISGVHDHSYIGQYQRLVSEMGREFAEMRATRRAYMLDVEPTPLPDGAKELDFTPWVPNLKIEDKHDDGLLPLKASMENPDFPLAQAFKKDPKALVGQFVRTEFGVGTITRVTTTRGRSTDEDTDDSGRGLSKVQVELAQGGNVEMLSASKVYLATNLTERSKNKYNAKAPKITEADKARTAPNRKKAEEAVKRVRQRTTESVERTSTQAKTVRAKVVKEDAQAAREVQLYPVIYNEFLALEGMEDEADSKALRRFGFTRFGNYAYLPIKTYPNFTAVLEVLERTFTLDPKTVRYLDSLHDSFQSGRGRKFALELAPTSELPQFYRMRHRLTQIKNTRKPDLKLYPVILNGSLMLVVDLATNPIFRKYLNKVLKGVVGAHNKFQEADGMDIHFFTTKNNLVAKIRELRQNGFNITNLEELKEEVRALNFKSSSKR